MSDPPICTKPLQYTLLRARNLLLNTHRLFAKSILIRAPILLPTPQHVRGPRLNHTLYHAPSQLHDVTSQGPIQRRKKATHSPTNMPLQPLLPILMHRMALPNLTQTIPHQKLIVPRREQRRGHINQDRDPGVIHIGESLAAEEDGGHDPRSEVSGEVGGYGDVGEAPDHGSVCEADGEGSAGGGDEGVRGVETGPDYDADVGVDEEFDHEEVA